MPHSLLARVPFLASFATPQLLSEQVAPLGLVSAPPGDHLPGHWSFLPTLSSARVPALGFPFPPLGMATPHPAGSPLPSLQGPALLPLLGGALLGQAPSRGPCGPRQCTDCPASTLGWKCWSCPALRRARPWGSFVVLQPLL